MELFQVIDPQPKRVEAMGIELGISIPWKPKDVPANAMPYRAPNGLWFWAVPSKKETVQ